MTIYKFQDKVFDETSAWYPYYADYKGHTFKIVGILNDPEDGLIEDHVYLECVSDPSIKVKGCVHAYDLEVVS